VGTGSLAAELVLVDCDDVFVGEDGLDLGLHVGQVISGEKRRGEYCPHGEVGAVLSQGEIAVADFEHVGIVPVARPRVFGQASLLADDVVNAAPIGPHVTGGAPEVAAEGGRPLPNRIPSVLAEGVDDRVVGGLKGLAHLVVGGKHEVHPRGLVVRGLGQHDVLAKAAKVVLEVVDAPGSVELGVLDFVVQRGWVAGAGFASGSRVDAKLEALGVNVVGQSFHVREFVVGVKDTAGIAFAFPGVIDVDVDVAGVFHPGGNDLVGGVTNVLVGNFACEVVPTVPAHGRGQ